MNCSSLPFRTAGAELKATLNARTLQDFIADYVTALFPENGIDYWSDCCEGVNQVLDRIRHRKAFVHHPFAYAASGSSEGLRIEAGVVLRGGEMVCLASAKTFGSNDECWSIARQISGLLECIFWFETEPYLVHMYRDLRRVFPRKYPSNPLPTFAVCTGKDSVRVSQVGGDDLDLWQLASHGKDVSWFVRAYAQDWATVLRACGAEGVTFEGEHLDILQQPSTGLAFWSDR